MTSSYPCYPASGDVTCDGGNPMVKMIKSQNLQYGYGNPCALSRRSWRRSQSRAVSKSRWSVFPLGIRHWCGMGRHQTLNYRRGVQVASAARAQSSGTDFPVGGAAERRLTIRLPATLARELDALADEKGLSLEQLCHEVLRKMRGG